jgi:hypothetical protein
LQFTQFSGDQFIGGGSPYRAGICSL